MNYHEVKKTFLGIHLDLQAVTLLRGNLYPTEGIFKLVALQRSEFDYSKLAPKIYALAAHDRTRDRTCCYGNFSPTFTRQIRDYWRPKDPDDLREEPSASFTNGAIAITPEKILSTVEVIRQHRIEFAEGFALPAGLPSVLNNLQSGQIESDPIACCLAYTVGHLDSKSDPLLPAFGVITHHRHSTTSHLQQETRFPHWDGTGWAGSERPDGMGNFKPLG